MKFDIYEGLVSQSPYYKFQSDLVTLGGIGGGNRKSRKTLRVEKSG